MASVIVAWFSLGLRARDLRIPFSYSGDALFYLAQTRMLGSAGSYLHTQHLGWPVGLQTYDYPQGGDHLHLGALWMLMRVTNDPMLSVNLYYLAGFALTAFIAHLVLRRLGVGPLVAGTIALIYAITPYHFSRGERHLFLSAYFLVPVGVGLALVLLELPDGRPASSLLRSPWVLLGVFAIASAGAYYFAFSLLLFVAAAVGAAVTARRARFLWPGMALSGLGLGVFLLNHAPTIWYWAVHGINRAALPHRYPSETERCGLRIAELFLPQPNHRISALAGFTQLTMRGWGADETGQQIGLVAATGLVLLLGALTVAAIRRHDPDRSTRSWLVVRLGRMGYLATVCLLTASVGGLSYLLSAGGLGLIRCWNRISVVIAFLGLTAIAMVCEHIFDRVSLRSGRTRRIVTISVLAGLVLVALIDQTPAGLSDKGAIERSVASDRMFFAAIAAQLPTDAKVFELPNIQFPEGTSPNGTGAYDPAKGYLYQPNLYWSFGVMRGRPDDGVASLAQTDPADLPGVLARAGYQGLVLDNTALGDRSASVEAVIAATLGDPIRSTDGRYLFHRVVARQAMRETPTATLASAPVDHAPPDGARSTSCQ